MSREIAVTTTALTLLLAASAPTFAAQQVAQTPEQMCAQQAKAEYVGLLKRHAFIKSCVEKHQKSMEGAKKAGPASTQEPAGVRKRVSRPRCPRAHPP
jgi:hypothetical protein